MKRTILYYPYIAIPSNWLKKSLLYWDEIGSIIPRNVGESAITPDMKYLIQLKILRPFDPTDIYCRSTSAIDGLKDEFEGIVNSEKFKNFIYGNRLSKRYIRNIRTPQTNLSFSPQHFRINTTPIHRDKISMGLIEFLERQGLVISNPDKDYLSKHVEDPNSWLLMEKKTAGLYMSLLAKYLADIDINATVSGTNKTEFHGLSYDPYDEFGAFSCYTTTLHDILPVPSDYVSFDEIIEFKDHRIDELTKFRLEIQKFQTDLTRAENPTQIKEIVVSFSEKIKREVNIINKTMREANIDSQMGTLQTFVKMGVPTLLTGMVGPILSNMGIVQVPVEISIATAATVGLINVSTYVVGRKNQRQAYLRDNPFSYLYHGVSEGLM
ncbi:MAG: hypothetical protein CVU39_06425 [Chloroflexi bacterium HGW-Chloroflexi-10]|nr:MAG: hypothetical protein CVU39_06425 [Chloroflexi bacterium HGW-Chloroflexi-10]